MTEICFFTFRGCISKNKLFFIHFFLYIFISSKVYITKNEKKNDINKEECENSNNVQLFKTGLKQISTFKSKEVDDVSNKEEARDTTVHEFAVNHNIR